MKVNIDWKRAQFFLISVPLDLIVKYKQPTWGISNNETEPSAVKGILRGFPVILVFPIHSRLLLCHQIFLCGMQLHSWINSFDSGLEIWSRDGYRVTNYCGRRVKSQLAVASSCLPVVAQRSWSNLANYLGSVKENKFCAKKFTAEMISADWGWAWCSLLYENATNILA